MEEKYLLTPEQVSEILQINTLTVYSYIKQGKLGAIRLGRTYRILPEDLKNLLDSNRVKVETSRLNEESHSVIEESNSVSDESNSVCVPNWRV